MKSSLKKPRVQRNEYFGPPSIMGKLTDRHPKLQDLSWMDTIKPQEMTVKFSPNDF